MKFKSRQIIKNLSHSILLRESGSPALLRIIILFFTLIIGIFIYWAGNIELNQVVIASGEILTQDDVVEIQHPEGGIIKELFVEEDELVKEGDTLLNFDGILISSKIKEEISKIETINRRITLLEDELEVKKDLLDQQLISKTSYLVLERSYNESLGERTQSYYALEGYRYLNSQLNVKSPIDGYMHYLQNRTIGTIIKPGETIFEIIPIKREYVAELRLDAKDRGKVREGQNIILKFASYDYSKYGGLNSTLTSISRTSFLDSYGRAYFKIYVDLHEDYLGDEEQELKILPGMTLTGDINVGTKSLLEYLLVPVKAAKDNSFNET